jgi:hypothetical protein
MVKINWSEDEWLPCNGYCQGITMAVVVQVNPNKWSWRIGLYKSGHSKSKSAAKRAATNALNKWYKEVFHEV